ncbi:TPA: hypothetical protein QC175_005714 [Bacillus cereus]|nr:hypothetical protein [Bacillus cereus]HDR8330682.1 hypothetical protein [Bacillus cereus]HDR8338257.1 hypothetical protein [Bacillus cereus]
MKIDEIKELAGQIKELKLANFNNDKIKEFLKLEVNPDGILEKFEEVKDFHSIEEAAKLIQNGLGGKWNYRKVYKLVNDEKIASLKDNNKHGRRIHIDEITKFIDENKLTREDYKKKFEDEEEKNKTLTTKVQALEAKIKELEAELKKRPAPKTRAKKEKEETGKVE